VTFVANSVAPVSLDVVSLMYLHSISAIVCN